VNKSMIETLKYLVANWRRSGRRIVGIVALGLMGALFLLAQETKPSQPQTAAVPSSSQASPSSLPPIRLDESAVLHHLNQLIRWYRQSTTGIQSVGLPSDAIYQDNIQSLGSQAVQLGFQSAKAETVLITAEHKNGENQPSTETTQQQNLSQMEAKTSSEIDQLQSQIETLNSQIAKTPPARRAALISRRDAVQSQVQLQKALLDAIEKMSSFVETNGKVSGGLEGGIEQLARSIPDVLGTTTSAKKTPTAATPAKPSLANSGGLISEAISLYGYISAMHQIDEISKETDYTRDVADHLRTPLRDALRATIQRSQQLAGQPPATDPQQLQAEKQEFQELTERFKQLTGALLPLSQEMIVLNDSKTSFDEWRNSISHDSRQVMRSVLFRVIGIVLALAVILVLSQIWRRITFRYVGDPRRRRQFLVMRRVVIGFLIAVVLVLGFVSEFSSLATFAGFITAGIAVGLQAVLLSVAAYFFIIGRYGIRVGDRISVAGVTGDVVDIGLVRLYLMELAGTGLDFYPTGRIVVFSNAVLFQTSTPLFKQIPGTEYAWHEVVVMIAPGGNHKMAQEKLVAGVNAVYSKYRENIDRQHAAIERHVDIQVDKPRPEARLQFSDTGLELLVRYPVEIRNAPDTDEEMTRKVLELIETDAGLKAAVSGTPKIRSAVKG
jgi:small-conductance mechanosensitive channel